MLKLKSIITAWRSLWRRATKRDASAALQRFNTRARERGRSRLTLRKLRRARKDYQATLPAWDRRPGHCTGCGQPSDRRQCYQCEDAIPVPYGEAQSTVTIPAGDRL